MHTYSPDSDKMWGSEEIFRIRLLKAAQNNHFGYASDFWQYLVTVKNH